MGPAGAGPGEQGAHYWGSPAPDRQWPGTDASAVMLHGDGRPGADTALSSSRDGERTATVQARKSMLVAYLPEYQKAYFRSTGRGNGATGVHQSII